MRSRLAAVLILTTALATSAALSGAGPAAPALAQGAAATGSQAARA